MQPLKITIPGKFWDSYVYEGRIYLFARDGSVECLKWAELIYDWRLPDLVKLPFTCAFARSDFLYSMDLRELMHDREVRLLMQSKFRTLGQRSFEIDKKVRTRHTAGTQDNPCPFPHADLEIYKQCLYVGSKTGIVSASCNKQTRYPISTRTDKKWDAPTLALSASYGSLAIAAGDEGLYEYNLDSYVQGDPEPTQLSKVACRDCDYTYFSVFASSGNSGYLAEFTKVGEGGNFERHFEGIETAQAIFGTEGYSWGVQDKICQALQGTIKVARYTPWADADDERIQSLGNIRFAPWKGDIVSASTASFGVIVELENAIVVLPSAGRPITLRGEPVNWRVFPRSRHYKNQLHVVYDDRLEVLSFNHDYLVDQKSKLLGTKFSARQHAYNRNLR